MMTRFQQQIKLLLVLAISTTFQDNYQILSDRNTVLYDFCNIFNTTATSIGQCLQLCLANCLCKSFQLCHQTECQLCSSNKYVNPDAMRYNENCSTFNFEAETSVNRCEKTCTSSSINCCLTSDPCFNGGTCVPTIGSNNIQRYTCKCPPYYHGYRCEIPMKSCKDVAAARASAFPPSPGKYAILDHNSNPFNVFCDFENHNSAKWAWTLVQSYALREKTNFVWKPFQRDSPKESEKPNWSLYRISKPRMQSIRNESTKWRVTCCYDTTYSVDYRDYVRGTFSNIDILDYYGHGCVKVDYISVRGQSCSNCTAYALQKSATFNFPRNRGNCDLRTTNFKVCPDIEQWLSKFETNFGYYGCASDEHLCSANQNSTTQTWFGA